ncbi:SCO family protein [Accumulibacter sp.]|uniref:SCO family protein n=1 Tax=Accumulibacter sp. TaxID=2053492 RepID=UPI0028C474AE|nr:SCO family protein [Accumulibacter sp.]
MKALLLGLLTACLAVPPLAAEAQVEESVTTAKAPITGRYLLMDANGRAVSNEDFPGQFQLLTFGYTSCPDVCPTTLAEMAVVMSSLGKDADHLQALFVTVDPERDTATVLRAYVALFDPRIIALTGSSMLLQRAADGFKVRYEKVQEPGAPPEHYAVDHSAGMFLLGPNGRYLRKFAYAVPPAEIAEWIRELMANTSFRPASRRLSAIGE